tara:strand:+ start:105 stop:467 length:363 start_codon:yes stop_codon:yes gene_type:complete
MIEYIKSLYGKNMLRIPFAISGNHDDYICFSNGNGIRHMRVIKFFDDPKRSLVHPGCNLLGWNDGGHWGDSYFDESGIDKTEELHAWLTSNHPFDLFKGFMSDLTECLHDLKNVNLGGGS